MFPSDFLPTVPHSSGVYMMLDKRSKIIYIGKANNLQKRLTSYTRFSGADHNKTTIMLSHVLTVKTLLTHTEKEALLLEASLIKRHKPRYNILLRDDKNYPLIKVTIKETWPRVHMTRKRIKDGAKYFGPYSSSSSMWSTLRLLADMFPLRKCKGNIVRKRKRPCLNRQIGKCLAPCIDLADPIQYSDQVKKVIMILEGKNRTLVQDLQKEMNNAAVQLHFERAAELRDQIAALSRTLEKQIVASPHFKNQDIFGFKRQGTSVAVSLIFVREGLITGNRNFFLNEPVESDAHILSQALNQYYDDKTLPPKEILIPFQATDQSVLTEHFSDLLGSLVTLVIPQRGDKVQLLEMANSNAAHVFDEKDKKERAWLSLSESMKKLLHLTYTPNHIECLDISNTSGKQAVGSLVCFKGGEATKKLFRHYKIKTVSGPDDYAMMKEVLQRRLKRGIDENTLPDLFVVDGGRGQLSMAMHVADDLGIREKLDWVGIAKEKKSEGEKLYKPGRTNPLLLKKHNPVLLYLMNIRDESHRFGVTFHRRLRTGVSFASSLDKIPGIGNDRKKILLKHFGSVKRIGHASLEELLNVRGIGKKSAATIHSYYKLS